MIQETYEGNERFLRHLDALFEELYLGGCQFIQEKMNDVDGPFKFKSTLAEFYIGRLLLRRGFSIDFLPDNIVPSSSPDIRIKKDGKELLVEVMRYGDGPVLDLLFERLKPFLIGKPYRVDVELDDFLSLPTIGYEEVKKAAAALEGSLAEFEKAFSPSLVELEIETTHVIFRIKRISRNDGYLGVIRQQCIGVPTDKILENIKFNYARKAAKRSNFTKTERNKPYLIAFFSDLMYLDEMMFQEPLYGYVTGYDDRQTHLDWVRKDYADQVRVFKMGKEWTRIERASQKGWTEFLEALCLIPGDFRYIRTHGFYLTEPIMENSAGLLILTIADIITVFPNPFSEETMDALPALLLLKDCWIRPF